MIIELVFWEDGSELAYSGGPAETDPHRHPWSPKSSIVRPESKTPHFELGGFYKARKRLFQSTLDRSKAAPVGGETAQSLYAVARGPVSEYLQGSYSCLWIGLQLCLKKATRPQIGGHVSTLA